MIKAITKKFKLHKMCSDEENRKSLHYIKATNHHLVATDGYGLAIIRSCQPEGFIHKNDWQESVKGGKQKENELLAISTEKKPSLNYPSTKKFCRQALKTIAKPVFSVKFDLGLLNNLLEAMGCRDGEVELFFNEDGFIDPRNELVGGYYSQIAVKATADKWADETKDIGIIMPIETGRPIQGDNDE